MALAEPSPTGLGLPLRPAIAADLAADLAEVDAAIALVAAGTARRVRLSGLRAADAIEVVAAIAHARTEAAGLLLQVDRSAGGARLVIARPT